MGGLEERLSKNQLPGRGGQIEQRRFTLRAHASDIRDTTGNFEIGGSGDLENGSHQNIAHGILLKDGDSGEAGRLEVPRMHLTDGDNHSSLMPLR